MRTPASIAGHPIHPMLIVFPIGLLVFSLICDLAALGSASAGTWRSVALYTMVGGFAGALAAAVPGAIDLMSLTAERVRKIALWHMSLNLAVVALYAVNIWLRVDGEPDGFMPLLLSVVAVGVLGLSGWLGAEMVHKHGVGVDLSPDADTLEAPRQEWKARP